jgi:hypothetical protein
MPTNPMEYLWPGIVAAQAIYTAAKLRIPDLLASGPKTVAELASDSGAHVPSLERLLRALGTLEILAGSLSGPVSLSPGTAVFNTSGTTTLLGSATFDGSVSYSVRKHHALKYSTGVGTLADLSGDTINVSYSGSGREASATDDTISLKSAVSGGTGTYAGAAGSVKGKGSLDPATGTLSLQLTVTLKHALN